MKMNLLMLFEGHRSVCFIVYNTSKNIDIHSNIHDMGALRMIETKTSDAYKKRK
jgi:L-asparaginase II